MIASEVYTAKRQKSKSAEAKTRPPPPIVAHRVQLALALRCGEVDCPLIAAPMGSGKTLVARHLLDAKQYSLVIYVGKNPKVIKEQAPTIGNHYKTQWNFTNAQVTIKHIADGHSVRIMLTQHLLRMSIAPKRSATTHDKSIDRDFLALLPQGTRICLVLDEIHELYKLESELLKLVSKYNISLVGINSLGFR